MTSFYEAARPRGLGSPELDAAVSFFNFKTFAAEWAAQRIRDTPRVQYVIEQEPTPSGLNRVNVRPEPGHDAIETRVNIYFDLFLVEIASVKDALAQVANAAFRLGLSLADVEVGSAHGGLQSLTGDENTGLREWVVLLSRPDNWLWRLNDYRNQIAHRSLVGLSRFLASVSVRGESPTRGRVPAEFRLNVGEGPGVPLLGFLDDAGGRTFELADATVARLRDLLLWIQRPWAIVSSSTSRSSSRTTSRTAS